MTTSRLALGLCIVSVASSAHADVPADAKPEAKPHVDAGVKAYQAGQYGVASREFEAAYEIDPQPALLYAWAQALRLDGRCSDAIKNYKRYLDTQVTEAQRSAAQTGISLCNQDRPRPDDRPPPPPPPPPTHDDATAASRGWYRDRVGGGLAIGGLAAAGAGVTFLVLANRSEDEALRTEVRDEFVDLLDEATLRRRIGIVALGVGGALVIASIVRYASIWESKRVTVATTGTSLFAFGRF